jgi:hypothetical protein
LHFSLRCHTIARNYTTQFFAVRSVKLPSKLLNLGIFLFA